MERLEKQGRKCDARVEDKVRLPVHSSSLTSLISSAASPGG